ncbi:MAG: 3-deoxy-D-manno-octulosonic acid transferase [Deltaproteobacteria bacterium]|nr:3-deoxy-D-manno-octulosonic acid transferase [Deltaproteobacteria bacterium]
MALQIIYNLASFLAALVLAPVGYVLSLFVEKRRKTFAPRLGFQKFPDHGPTRPIWVHALSVGEAKAAAPLARALARRHPERGVVVSASTATGYEILKEETQPWVRHVFYYPYDLLFSVKKAFNRVDPALVVIVESDLWPNFLFEAKRRSVPVVLVNARLSERSLSGYRRFSFFFRPVFGLFSAVCAASEMQKERFESLLGDWEKVLVTGNIKFDSRPEEAPATGRQSLGIPEDAPVLVAGSTHEGEEEILARLFPLWRESSPGLVLVAAPRDPGRACKAAELFRSIGLTTALFSEIVQSPSPGSDVIVVDAMGALASLYGLADAAFVGASMIPLGGHNPLEGAAHGKPVVFGPHMEDFAEIAELLVDERAAIQVVDENELESAIRVLLCDREKAEEIGERAKSVVLANRGAVDKMVEAISRFL